MQRKLIQRLDFIIHFALQIKPFFELHYIVLTGFRISFQEMAYNVWKTTSNLWGTLIEMRIELQQLRQELKLYSVLNKQVLHLHKTFFLMDTTFFSVL